MGHRRLRSRDEERYLEALDEARDTVRLARRDYDDARHQLSNWRL